MTIFGFALATIFIPGWTGAAVPTGWVMLSIALPFIIWRNVEVGLEHLIGMGFLAYAFLSLMWTPVLSQGIFDLWMVCTLGAAFMFGAIRLDSTRLYVGLAFGVGGSTALAIPQLYFDWTGIYQFYRPAGLFVNPGVYGETCALVLVALLASKLYWPALLVAPGIYFSNSRTALVACGAAAVVFAWDKATAMGADRSSLWKNPYVLSAAVVLTLGSALAVQSTLTREPNWWTSPAERLAIWQDTASGLTWMGRGAGSFIITYPAFATRTDTMASRPEHAHSDILELVYDYGLGTIPLFLLIALALRPFPVPERYIFIAFLTIAVLSFPTRLPVEGFLGAFAMGRLCGSRLLVWDYSSRRRFLQPAWKGDAKHAFH